MTLTLTVLTAEWNRRVDQVAAEIPGLVPVVKGNGYGLGREWLADRASRLAPLLAVGTVHEIPSIPGSCIPVVLTPSLDDADPARPEAVLTIGRAEHLHAAARQPGRPVLVKVRSSMNRYGTSAAEANTLTEEARRLGLDVRGFSIHPPRSGSSSDHAVEIERLLDRLEPGVPVWVSHVDATDFARLRERHPTRDWFLRLGTELWHGDKSLLHLGADVLDVRPVVAGESAGYRSEPIPHDGTLVMVGCGSAHGISPLPDGSSPFHHARHRMNLVEPPHMHTSMCLVVRGNPVPAIGETVDVQRPLITTRPDVIRWA